MQFKLSFVAALFAATAIAAPVPAESEASCAQTAIAALNGATKEFTGLNKTLSSTTDLASLIKSIVSGLKVNLDTLAKGTSLPCSATLSQQDQKDICSAADSFVQSENALVSTLKAKSSLLEGSDLSPVAAIVRLLESGTETYLEPVIKGSPVCGGEIQTSVKDLESDINALLATL